MLKFFYNVALTLVLLLGCSRQPQIIDPPVDNSQPSSISFYFQKPAYLNQLVVSASALVTAPDMDSIYADLTVTPNHVEGTIDSIPAGPQRKFEIFTYDADTNLTYYGHELADVPAGQVITLQIILYPVSSTGTVIIVGSFANFPPAGGKIVFEADYTGLRDIYIMNPDGSGIINLTNTPALEEKYPRISPDGQKILFSGIDVNGIMRPFMMNIDGTGVHELQIFPGAHTTPTDWSPDMQKIVLHSWVDGDPEIYIYDPSAFQPVQLTFNTAIDWTPRWSPNGNWIAYQSNESGIFRNYLIHPDGSGKRLITPQISYLEEKHPQFSPDGHRISFYARDNSPAWDLFIVNSDGTNLIRLTNTPNINEMHQCWSPDGQRLLFVRDGGLYLINADGTGETMLLNAPGLEDYPHWR